MRFRRTDQLSFGRAEFEILEQYQNGDIENWEYKIWGHFKVIFKAMRVSKYCLPICLTHFMLHK